MIVNGTTSTVPAANGTTAANKELGKDQFLKLLLTQLKYQDPMQPMQDREFISQMAQFTSLEQMTNVASGMQKLQQVNSLGAAFNLLGATVTYKDAKGNAVSGVVSGAEVVNGTMQVLVGSTHVALENITKVTK